MCGNPAKGMGPQLDENQALTMDHRVHGVQFVMSVAPYLTPP